MFPSDDTATLFLPPTDAKLRKRFAKLVAWNPETFDNTVDIGGNATISNLDVHAGTDALSWQPGQMVVLEGYDAAGKGAWQTWWITGRVITPGEGNAALLIDFMRSTLARQISAEIFAERIHIDTIDAEATRSTAGYGDPATGGVGPTVADVEISEAGRAIVFLGGVQRTAWGAGFTEPGYGNMSVQVSGATSVSPVDANSLYLQATGSDSTSVQFNSLAILGTQARVALIDDLTPGLHTFTAKYKPALAATHVYVAWRSIVVIGL